MPLFRRGRDRVGQDRVGQDRVAAAKEAFERGQREFAAGRFAVAAGIFGEAVALTPDSPNSQFLLGASLLQGGDPKAAIDPLRRCVAMRPEHAEAHFLLSVALGRSDEFDEAEEHLARAAFLGDEQARERLAKVGADYCRTCGRPAKLWHGDTDADITFVTHRDGMTCADCHTVLCGRCASRGQEGPMVDLGCPACGGPLRLLTGPR